MTEDGNTTTARTTIESSAAAHSDEAAPGQPTSPANARIENAVHGQVVMASVSIRSPNGEVISEPVQVGQSLMDVLRGLNRVDAICGGSMSCGTCAVRVAGPWRDRLEAASDGETMLLEGLGLDGDGCRLSCQIQVTDALDGVVVEVLRAS